MAYRSYAYTMRIKKPPLVRRGCFYLEILTDIPTINPIMHPIIQASSTVINSLKLTANYPFVVTV